jgi:L-seryl-tRNA(Ser) seleniumtransferase
MRIDKMTIAALGATLELYRDPARALTEIPTLAMITAPVDDLRKRAEAVVEFLERSSISARVVSSVASVGAGAFPTRELPSAGVALRGNAGTLEQALRASKPPVIGRIADDTLVLDLRSVPAAHDAELAAAIVRALT